MSDVTGFIFPPPEWDESRLRARETSDAIRLISQASYTDIAFVEANNSIQITGDTREDVVRAQTQLNILFFPPEVKSKKSWARPDRPGSWGQRRDITKEAPKDHKKKDEKDDKKLKGKKSFKNLKRNSASGKENEPKSPKSSDSEKEKPSKKETDDGLVIEDRYYTAECYINYRGNAAPVMTWTGPDKSLGDWSAATTTTNVTVWSGVALMMSRFFSSYSFSLLTNFTSRGFLNPDSATNIPTWSYTYSTADLEVNWTPKSMYRAPEQPTYEIGDSIECFADSNPASTYYWRNLDTQEVYYDSRLVITNRLVGTQRMQCHAENVIGGVPYTNDYFFNLTVNALTTTPVPTTPTTTTPPLPEAACDNLSGRWTATTPSRADVCIQINNTNGRIVGLFRNATDPFFIEIRGKVKPLTYNQVGFTGVWPVNIGTLAFEGICRKCYGTEILLINGVGRRVTDNPTCANAGPFYSFPNYDFRRTGPPCTALFAEYNIKM